MKRMAALAIVMCAVQVAYAAEDGKTVRVDETKFSDLYPAVWFSPSTGEIAALKERSEVPPEEKYEIWIEPDDPEFGYNPDKKPMGVGFALIGKGTDAFKAPKIPDNPKLALKLTQLMKEADAKEQPVFYCKSKTSACLIMITSMDSKKRVIQFQWRLLELEKGAHLGESPTQEQKIGQLIEELANDRFDVREAASQQLQAIGESALAALEGARHNKDPEIRIRATQILQDISAQQSIQCAFNDEFLGYRSPAEGPDSPVEELFIQPRQERRWKVTRTEKGYVIQVASGPCKGWYFACNPKAKPFTDGDLAVVSSLQLNKKCTERSYWRLTQQEHDVHFIQPAAGRFRDWYLDIDAPRSTLLLADRVVPGAYWRIAQIHRSDQDVED